MASVSGILIRKLVPWPVTERTSMVPPIRSTLDRTTSMPMPRPDTLVIRSAVEKPGRKMSLWICASVNSGDLGFGHEPLGERHGLDPRGVETATIVGDLDHDAAALVPGRQPDRATLRLAGGATLGRRFEAMIGGVAHHVGQRIADEVEHLPVELGLGAVHLDIDRLAEFGRQIAHDPRQLLPGVADRLHPRLQHAFLQFGGDVRQPLQRPFEFRILVPAPDLDELIARQHEFGDHRHQSFERIEIDADRAIRDLAALCVALVEIGGCLGRSRRGRLRCVPCFIVRTGCLAIDRLKLVERDLAGAQRYARL